MGVLCWREWQPHQSERCMERVLCLTHCVVPPLCQATPDKKNTSTGTSTSSGPYSKLQPWPKVAADKQSLQYAGTEYGRKVAPVVPKGDTTKERAALRDQLRSEMGASERWAADLLAAVLLDGLHNCAQASYGIRNVSLPLPIAVRGTLPSPLAMPGSGSCGWQARQVDRVV